MDELKIFEKEGMKFEMWINNGKEFFPATEVAEILGYTNPQKAIRDHCKEDGCTNRSVIDSLGRTQQKKYINEGNLYRLIVKSQLASAEKFEKWVFDEVLPSIRKHGGYLTPQKIEEALLNPDTIIQLATNLKEERIKRIEAERINEVNKPKVLFADAVEASIDSILVRDMAKLLHKNGVNIGEKRLYQWLRDNNFVQKTCNHPTQKAVDLGVLEIKEGVRFGENKELKPIFTCMVTGKGQIYFINKLKEAA